jgi:hypothetical protein
MRLPASIVAILRSATLPVRQLGATFLAGSRFVRVFPVATFATAPFARFAFSSKPHGAQNRAAPFTNFTGVHSMLCEQCVALLHGEKHGYSSPSRDSA